MGNCILSVIVPVYNGQNYLSNIVQNILDKNKKISNWLEIIFVDDGSLQMIVLIYWINCLKKIQISQYCIKRMGE